MEARVAYHQVGPRLGNALLEDGALQRFAGVFLQGCSGAEAVMDDVKRFGDKVASEEYVAMAAEAERNLPQHEQFDQWGERVDKIHVSEGWKFFKKESAIEGLVSIPYVAGATSFSRTHQALKLMLFSPASALFSCPLAMTDGASATINATLANHETGKHKLPASTIQTLGRVKSHLISRDPEQFWTSGQWFTEKQGGSDVSRAAQTFAVPRSSTEDVSHGLYGFKWFTSAIDADVALTLANIVPSVAEAGEPNSERKKLALFLLETRASASLEATQTGKGELNGIQVVRLKSKFSTPTLPTAELILEDCGAHLLNHAGIRSAQAMLTVTRFHNATSAIGNMLRMRNLAVDWAHSRSAFGRKIVDLPLHLQILFEQEMDTRGNLLFVLEMARLIGRVEHGEATEREADTLRGITSLVKLFTGRESVRMMTEGVELFGAVGIMNNHMSALLRDSFVLPIWEGTTNTLSLDLVRIASKEPECFVALEEAMRDMAGGDAALDAQITKVFDFMVHADLETLEWNARRLSMNLSRLLISCLCIRTWKQTNHKEDQDLGEYWIRRSEHEFEPLGKPSSAARMRSTLDSKTSGASIDERGLPRTKL